MAKVSKHRFLFDKGKLLRSAIGKAIEDPTEGNIQYVRGLADALHGTRNAHTAKALHVARQVVIALKE